MSTEQSESAPAVTAPQVETKAAPAADVTQQATAPTATTQRVKNPKRVAAGKMVTERTRLAETNRRKRPRLITRKKPPQRPLSQPRLQKVKAQRAAASAPTSGLLLAAYAFPCSGFITNGKSSRQWPSPRSTNSKLRSPRLSPRLSPRMLSPLTRHSEKD